ncbi:MAG: KilA-N domain-containing protein, partial [Kiritimatiellae bacterium]|nr:KilA-N domain-containing protein [Kiritimatiellia bacterium]
MRKTNELDIKGTAVRVVKINGVDFVCLTDMAKLRSEDPSFTINHWMRNRMTIEYLGLWETLYNPNFKPTEFEGFRNEGNHRRLYEFPPVHFRFPFVCIENHLPKRPFSHLTTS